MKTPDHRSGVVLPSAAESFFQQDGHSPVGCQENASTALRFTTYNSHSFLSILWRILALSRKLRHSRFLARYSIFVFYLSQPCQPFLWWTDSFLSTNWRRTLYENGLPQDQPDGLLRNRREFRVGFFEVRHLSEMVSCSHNQGGHIPFVYGNKG